VRSSRACAAGDFVEVLAVTGSTYLSSPRWFGGRDFTSGLGSREHGSAQTSQATDPGVRSGAAGAGGRIATLNQFETSFWFAAQAVFEEVETVPTGLGPRFNLNSLRRLSRATGRRLKPRTNLEVAVATLDGANKVVPPFVTANGPVREARFVRNPNETPDGGVAGLSAVALRLGRQLCDGLRGAAPCLTPQALRNWNCFAAQNADDDNAVVPISVWR
jgi:hypothetical protein